MSMITTSDGTHLNVEDEGTGPVTVLIGGYGAAAAGWTLQREALRQAHRVITIDRRCHGHSEKPTHGQRMARHAKDIRDVLDALQLDAALMVGSSMGSNTILAYVDLFGTDRLRGVVLVDQTPKMINEGEWELGCYGVTRQTVDAFVQKFPEGLKAFHADPPAEVLTLLAGGPEFSIDDTRELLRDHTEKDWRDVLPRIDVPVLAIGGRHSPVWPCEPSEWMAMAAPLGMFEVFEQSGHVPFLEEPARFNEVLLHAAIA